MRRRQFEEDHENEMNEIISPSPPKRPLILDKILKTTAARDDHDQLTYQQFLHNSYFSIQNNSPEIHTSLSWTYADDPIPNHFNCSLCSLFFFYTKVQLPATKLHLRSAYVTSDQEVLGRSCLSLYELFLLLRDFRIIPKLISREEVLFLWKLITSMKKTRREETVLLEFSDFQELFGRIAILTFNKPLIQRVVLTARGGESGKMPSYEEQILSLSHYLHLDDYNWVKNRLHTVGAQSVSLINARSGEINPSQIASLRDDVKGKRIANWLAQGDISSASSGGHVNITQMKTIMDSTYLNSRLSPRGSGGGGGGYKKQQPSSSFSSVENEENTSSLLEQVINQLKSVGQWPHDTDTDSTDHHLKWPQSMENHLFSQSTLPPHDPPHSPSNTTPPLLPLTGIKLSQTQENALIQYLPSHTRVLDRYSDMRAYSSHRRTQSDPEREARGNDIGLLDMGMLVEDQEVIIRLYVTNQTAYEMSVEVSVDHIAPVKTMRVTALPESLAPGLSKTVYLTFTVPTLPESRRNYSFRITIRGISTQVLANTLHAVHSLKGEIPSSSQVILPNTTLRGGGGGGGGNKGTTKRGFNSLKNMPAIILQDHFVFARIIPEEFFQNMPSGDKEGIGRNGMPHQLSSQVYPHCTSQSLERLYRMTRPPSQQSTDGPSHEGQVIGTRQSERGGSGTRGRPMSAGATRPTRPLSGHPKNSLRNR
jgi:hypothetical protein